MTSNTYFNLASLKASAVAEGTAFLAQDGSVTDGLFYWTLGNFTAKVDDKDVIKSDNAPLTVGAWVRQDSGTIAFQQAGTNAVRRPLQTKAREMVSVRDFGATGDGVTNDTAAFQAALAHAGTTATAGTVASVYVPNGTYLVDYIGIQGAAVIGQSRLGTVIKCISGGTAAVLDSRFNRDGIAANTQGSCAVENLSIDVNGRSRDGICAYGGSCIVRNVEVFGSATSGLRLQYVLMTTVENVTARNNMHDGFVMDVDSLHSGDVNTSISFTNAWALENGRHGFNGSNIHYANFVTCCSQANGSHGWNFDGSTGGVNAMYAVTFVNCASEADVGRAFNLKKLRNFSIIDPFVIATASQHTIHLDDCIGAIAGFTDMATHTGGTYSLKIVNPLLPGLVRIQGGDFKIDAADRKYCTFSTTVVGGEILNTTPDLTFPSASDLQAMRVGFKSFGTDYSGLAVEDSSGSQRLFVRRAGGVILSSFGALSDTGPMLPGDIHMYAGTTALSFQVKGTDGTIRTGQIALS